MKRLEGEFREHDDCRAVGGGLVDRREASPHVIGFVGGGVLLDESNLHAEDRNSIAFGGDHNPMRGAPGARLREADLRAPAAMCLELGRRQRARPQPDHCICREDERDALTLGLEHESTRGLLERLDDADERRFGRKDTYRGGVLADRHDGRQRIRNRGRLRGCGGRRHEQRGND